VPTVEPRPRPTSFVPPAGPLPGPLPGPVPGYERRIPAPGWVPTHPVLTFVGLTYAISWSLWGIAYLLGESVLGGIVFVAGAFGPAAAAAIVLKLTGGSLTTWARAIVHWRVPLRYWVYALGLPAAMFGAVNLVLVAMGEPVEWSLLGERALPYLATFVVTMLILGGQEEPGWRGFALPRLQQRYRPLQATAILGLAWGFWHLPVMGPLGFVVPFLLAFLYTWLYNRTGSVLLAILLHASFTPAQDHLTLLAEETHGTTDVAIGLVYLVAVLVVVGLTRGRLGFDEAANERRVGPLPHDEARGL
jgi:uncharacterized protein